KTETAVQAEEDDKSPDFSSEAPQQYTSKIEPMPNFDQRAWEYKLRRYSAVLKKYPEVYQSFATLQFDHPTRYFVSSEGTRVVTGKAVARLLIMGETRAEDGMELLRSESFDASTPEGLPL